MAKVAERIKSNLDIVELMESAGIEFESKSARSAKACCFAHTEDTPSLVVNRDKQLFNCFGAGCEAGGDLVAFWMQFTSTDFYGACHELIEKFNVDVQDLVREPSDADLERERLLDINNRVAEALFLNGQRSKLAAKWFEARGLAAYAGPQVLEEFKVGFCENLGVVEKLANTMRLQQKDVELLQFDARELFTNRVIYPIQDVRGDVLSFYGRTLSSDRVKYIGMHAEHKRTGLQHPLMSPDVPYGLCHARPHLREAKALVLVEGFNDVLVAHAHGLGFVAGMRGAMPTARMYELLKTHHVNDLIVCPDGDDAGYRTVDQISKNRARHQTVKIMTMPSDVDPDEFIMEHGAEGFQARLQDAVYPVELIIRGAAERLSGAASVSDRLDVTKELATHINVLTGFEREFALQELATLTGTDRQHLDALIASSGGADFSDAGLESRVLAECMSDRGKAIHGLSVMKPEDFSIPRHGVWWKLLRQMLADDIEVFTREMFITYAVDKSVLSADDVNQVPKEALGSISLDYAAKRLVEMSMRRRLNKAGSDFIHSLQNPKKAVDDALTEHMRVVSTAVVNEKAVTSAGDHVIEAMDVIEERMKNPGIPGLDLGPHWRKLMSQIMGFQPGHMLSVAGVSKAGKTTIAQNWCMEQLKNCGEPTLWINLEMSALDLTLRNLSILTGIPNQRLKIGNISKEERAKLEEASAAYHGFPLHVASMAGASVFDVVNTVRKFVYSEGVKVFFVDYLQLIQSTGRSDKMALWEAQNEVVAAIRQAISTLKVTGVVISQLNRGAMAEGSASGQFVAGTIKLIQDSDVFMGLKKKTKEEQTDNPHANGSLIVEFNRHGPQETIIDLDCRYDCGQMEEV